MTGFDPSVLQPSCAFCDNKCGIWNGLQPGVAAAICLAGCVGKLPCAANSVLCMHGGFGLHKVLECEVCCAELECHKEGEVGCAPEAPKFKCNTGLVDFSCDRQEDFLKHFCMQCGICCCHCWCTKQACFGAYCKDPKTIVNMACCTSSCCCFAADVGCSHLQSLGCCCCTTSCNCCEDCATPVMVQPAMAMRGHGEFIMKNADFSSMMAMQGGGGAPGMAGGFNAQM